jgi:hypothetical protein
MIVTDEMVENTERYKNRAFRYQVEVDSITIDTNHGSNRHDIEKYFHKLYGISTSTGYVLTSAQDAMFNNFHEGIHLA